jgi:soluble lytic murein transglycosylase
MFGTLTSLTLALAIGAADPRPRLVELQLEGKTREALGLAEQELASRPAASRQMGLDYLRGHLLALLGNHGEANEAFVEAMGATPALSSYSRYRLAMEQDRMSHPEVAAGLIATVVGGDPRSPLVPDAVRLLSHTLAKGGDCRLLRGIRSEILPVPQRRELLIAQADCALSAGMPELGRGLLVSLLEERREDDPAQVAAERLENLVSESESGRLPMLLGLTFHQHREFDRALRHLKRSLGEGNALAGRDDFEARYALGRSHFWQGRYAPAVEVFGDLVERAATPEQKARALYQQGRSYELLGSWKNASASFRLSYLAEPQGVEWAAAALLSALRLEWRANNEAAALPLYDLLAAEPAWREQTARAALFLVSSDVVKGRADRARPWLDRVEIAGGEYPIEAAYWRGRVAELEKDPLVAVAAYLRAVRPDPYHPVARAALARLAAGPLAKVAAAEGRRLAASERPEDLHGAWLLLGSSDPTGRTARKRLQTLLLADRLASPYLRLSEIPVRRWPFWQKTLTTPEEMLLALGLFGEAAPAIRKHFPLAGDPSLAYTGSLLLARGDEIKRSMEWAELLRIRTPPRVPLALQSADYRRVIYPHPYQEVVALQARVRGADPDLLTAIIREESRLDPLAFSPAAARGLSQLTLQTARRLAAEIGLPRTAPGDLYRPETAITLGAANLAGILKEFGNAPHVAAAAYNAGEPQARVWKSYCFSQEPEEFFAKVGFRETRAYLRRVLTSQEHYEELY